MQANGLNESSVLLVGVVLNIPPVVTDPNTGSSFKIIPDSELVYGPASVGFDLDSFLQNKGGYLANYMQDVNGEYLSGSQIIMRVAQNYSVNPRLLVALLEYRSGWVTTATPTEVDFPLGNYEFYYAGLYRQTAWTAKETIPVQPAEVVVVEGILVLVDPGLRSMLDIKVFVDADADDRLGRVIQRDIVERGRSVLQVLAVTMRPLSRHTCSSSSLQRDMPISSSPEGRRILWGLKF